MENKIDRVELAESIYSKLIVDETYAMELWSKNVDQLKLTASDLPCIDVLTCVYNAEAYIAHAIESILFQSWPNIHLVIVTDPCTDKTIDIIKQYTAKYSNITLHENNDHQGIIACFNKGLEYCNSNFIARMDLDDLIHPLRFEKQMNFLNVHPDIGVISSYMRVFNELKETKDVTYRDDFDIQKITMLFFSPLSHAGSIFRADVIKSIGYRDDFKYAEDFDLWYQIMSRFKTAVYPEFLYLYRTHSNQVTNARNLLIFKKSWFEIMRNIFQDLKLKFTDEDIYYHIDNVLLVPVFDKKEDWTAQHSWFNRIVLANKESLYFNHEKLTQFIYNGYWLTPFLKYKNQLNWNTFLSQLFSEINKMTFGQKLKEIVKYILKK